MLTTTFFGILVTSGINIICADSAFLFPEEKLVPNSTDKSCPELQLIIPNGKITIENLGPYGHRGAITCNDGYDIEGKNFIYCADGQWELYNPLPQCIKHCFPPPYLTNGALDINGRSDEQGYYFKGTVAMYNCSEGFELSPKTSSLRVCEKGIWTGPVASCIPIVNEVRCPTLKPIANGYFELEDNEEVEKYKNVGQRLHYNCKIGYSLIGAKVQECLEDGSWLPKMQPICIPVDETENKQNIFRISEVKQ